MAKATPLASEDVKIVSLAVDDGGALRTTRPTSFTFEIAINGTSIGEEARLAEVFGVEGATELSESAFSSDGSRSAFNAPAKARPR